MKTLTTFILSALVLVGTAYAETVSLSTYYPAPFGAYDRLRLVPRSTAPSCTTALEGLLYYDAGQNVILICRSQSAGFEYLPGVWTQNNIDSSNADVYLSEPTRNVNVGIGTTNPQKQLSVGSDSNGIFSDGSNNFTFAQHASSGASAIVESEGDVWLNMDVSGNSTNKLVIGKEGFGTASTPIMTVLENGNVGIGEPTPSAQLEVLGDIKVGNGNQLELETGSSAVRGRIYAQEGSPHLIIRTTGGEDISFQDGTTVNVLIDGGNGDVDIGDAPSVASQKLNVDGGINLKDNGTNWGKLMVQYDSGTQGYYAVYAP